MGRAKEFCVDYALERALEVFWRHGFEGASLSDLTAAMGITRPSLYATYGNKEKLFRKALDLYESKYLGFRGEALEEPTARQVVARLLTGFVEVATVSESHPGCMGYNGALACSTASDPVKDEVFRRRDVFEGFVRRRLEEAQELGDLPTRESSADLARFVMVVAGGIAVQACSGASRESLMRAAHVALRAWPVREAVPA